MSALPFALVASAALWASVLAGTVPPHGGPAGLARVSATQELPDGPGKKLLSRLCEGCHDLMFTVSTRETKEGWTRIVNDMRGKGADGTDQDFEEVIAYLAANFGKPEHAEPMR